MSGRDHPFGGVGGVCFGHCRRGAFCLLRGPLRFAIPLRVETLMPVRVIGLVSTMTPGVVSCQRRRQRLNSDRVVRVQSDLSRSIVACAMRAFPDRAQPGSNGSDKRKSTHNNRALSMTAVSPGPDRDQLFAGASTCFAKTSGAAWKLNGAAFWVPSRYRRWTAARKPDSSRRDHQVDRIGSRAVVPSGSARAPS